MRTGVSGVNAVVFVEEGLMSVFLRPERAGKVAGTPHGAAALVIQAQDGRRARSAVRSP